MFGSLLKSGCLLVACILIVGCSRSASLEDNFKDASPAVKQTWNEAVKLDKADKYMAAAETYDSLFQMKLTLSQEKMVEFAISQMYLRLHKAAAEGDANARKVSDMIEASRKAEPQ